MIDIITSTPVGVRSSLLRWVCLSVSMHVCPLSYLKNPSRLHKIFETC